MLLKRQYVTHIIRVIDDLVIQQMSNMHANSLHARCWSQIRKVGDFWDRLDSDHISTEGDSLYKTLSLFDMLSS